MRGQRQPREQDDVVRESGPFSPNLRDNAERVRSQILYELLEHSGEDAWEIKQELLQDPLFIDMKDRIISLIVLVILCFDFMIL